MFSFIGAILINLFSSGDYRVHHTDGTDFDFGIGDRFNELSPESQELLHQSQHFDKKTTDINEDPRWAKNTDNCFVFDKDCQPDYEHHIFKVPMRDHQGYFYTITFSYNWIILNIDNGYSHG
jgi:hypothetical protein